MTDREKAIVTAYTGACMLSGDGFRIFHEYIENIMGRPVYMHELAYKPVEDEIKEKAKADFIALCAEHEPCEDCISRQVVLKQLKSCLTGGETEYNYVKLHIDSIPPVTPQPKTDTLNKIRAEIIDAIQNGTLKIERGNEMLFRIIDKYKESEE